ncbi:MAG: hypothetical protein QXU44_09600 [Candidatus Caldarchaeum sp.]
MFKLTIYAVAIKKVRRDRRQLEIILPHQFTLIEETAILTVFLFIFAMIVGSILTNSLQMLFSASITHVAASMSLLFPRIMFSYAVSKTYGLDKKIKLKIIYQDRKLETSYPEKSTVLKLKDHILRKIANKNNVNPDEFILTHMGIPLADTLLSGGPVTMTF